MADLAELPEFVSFASIPRLKRNCIITEKIDGTNAQVLVLEDGRVLAGSRSRYITPEDDNFGFAAWVKAHEEELRVGLGLGRHFGEWWGPGIQRRYGIAEKRFSLFNTQRWGEHNPPPAPCSVVPVMYSGPFTDLAVNECLDRLHNFGSVASPGFMLPEGVVVFLPASGTLHKVTLGGDGHKTAGDPRG